MRTRLTLWYVGVLAGTLVLYLAATLFFIRASLQRELDEALQAEFERVEDLLAEEPDGAIRMRGHDEGRAGSLVEVWSKEGALLYRSEALGGQALGRPSPTAEPGRSLLASFMLPGGAPVRVLTRAHSVGSRDTVMRVAISEEHDRHQWQEMSIGLMLALPLALSIAALGGHWLARRALGPLERMAKQAETLTADSLDQRLPVENADDELGHLARVFNLSLARIQESFGHLRRFTADASHELRTPLTAIRTVGEVTLQHEQNPERYREAIGSMLEEVDRLTHLVGSLLVLSRADAGTVLRRQSLRLVDLARQSASLLEILAEEKGQTIEVRGDTAVTAQADGLILRQALINLIDNAIKYSPPGVPVVVNLRSGAEGAIVEVIDQGPGIPEPHRSRVFERFYRIDAGRSRDEGGAGLGLSIALWAVQTNGGRIELLPQQGSGSTFRIVLPPAPPSDAAFSPERDA